MGQADLVGQIEAVLAVPLLTSTRRGILRSNLREISSVLHKQERKASDFRALSADGSSVDTGVAPNDSQYQMLIETRRGLFEAIVGSLADNLGVCQDKSLKSEPMLDAVGPNAEEDTREELKLPAGNSQDVRFAAALAAGPSDEVLRGEFIASMQALLLWHAENTLGDFWGAAGTGDAFYHYATLDYLKGVELFSRQQQGTSIKVPVDRNSRI